MIAIKQMLIHAPRDKVLLERTRQWHSVVQIAILATTARIKAMVTSALLLPRAPREISLT
jgi:hypothetical protein